MSVMFQCSFHLLYLIDEGKNHAESTEYGKRQSRRKYIQDVRFALWLSL